MKRIVLLLFAELLPTFFCSAQNQLFYNRRIVDNSLEVNTLILPQQLLAAQQNVATDDFAIPIATNFNIDNSGQWYNAVNERVWRLALSSPSAYSLNLLLTDFYLPCGAEFCIYGADTSEVIIKYTADNNSDYLPTIPIAGNLIIVKYIEPYNVDFSGRFNIVQVGHDFRGLFAKEASLNVSECEINIDNELAEDWQIVKRSVCKILIGGTTLCSGVLLNSTDGLFEPYVLTARHCISTAKQAQNSVFYFNYETPDSIDNQYIIGADLIALKDNDDGYLDFALLKLKSAIPDYFNVYYSGWDISDNQFVGATCIHHPNGDVKKISITTDTLKTASYRLFDDNTFWNVEEWASGVTEIGSSGAPLFNSEHNVIGILSGGDSNCDYPMNDFFQKLSACYSSYNDDSMQLAHWLNPQAKSIKKLDGAFKQTTSSKEHKIEHNITVSPNPANSSLLVMVENSSVACVQMFDLQGNEKYCQIFKNEQNVGIDIHNLQNGVYVCKVTLQDESECNELIIKQ